MMDSGPVRNMYSTLSNKFKKLCSLLGFIFIIRMHIQCWPESTKEKRPLYKTDLSVHGKIIRKMYPKETRWKYGLDRSGSGYGQMAVCSEHGNETWFHNRSGISSLAH